MEVRVWSRLLAVVCAACVTHTALKCRAVAAARGDKRVNIADSLQRRTDEILSQLTNYETVIPELVDQDGKFLSYDVTHLSVLRHRRSIRRSQSSRRSKRRAGNSHGIYLDGSDQLGKNSVFYKLRANGKEFHFNLTLNTDLLSNDFVVEYWGTNGTVHRTKELWDCHYSGSSTGPTHTNAALSNCVGLIVETASEGADNTDPSHFNPFISSHPTQQLPPASSGRKRVTEKGKRPTSVKLMDDIPHIEVVFLGIVTWLICSEQPRVEKNSTTK